MDSRKFLTLQLENRVYQNSRLRRTVDLLGQSAHWDGRLTGMVDLLGWSTHWDVPLSMADRVVMILKSFVFFVRHSNSSIPPAYIISEDQCSYTINRSVNHTVAENVTLRCTKWSFSRQYLGETLVTKFDLVCDRALEIRSVISLLNLCTLFAIFYSFLQDKIGRKRAFLVNLFFHVVFNVAASIFPRNIMQFASLKFIAGVTCMWEICFCWALEFVGGPKQRTLVTTLMSIVYGLANMFVALVAWLCQDWDVFTFCTAAPFVLLISFIWLVPESPRWLFSQNRVDEAAEIVCSLGRWKKSSKVDIVTVKQLLLDINSHSSSDQPSDQMTIGQFLRSKNLLYKNLLITLASVIANQLYGMIPYDSEHIFSNFYVAYLLPTSVELPAVILNLFLVNKLGRTLPLSGFLFLSAFCCLATWPLEYTGGEWSTVVLASMARFFISAGLAVQEQMAEELYPTVGRGVGTGISYIASSLTGLASQFLIYSSIQWKLLPLIIMGCLTMATSFVCLFLPDTFGKPLPDSVQSAEAQGAVGCKAFKENVSYT
uniref:Major facilitator superfamily (MFS) profile domain-containing protein n=1 Tax=Romanomermis culicivorax TaxID=13658 RepID=A0A915K802_ROMCU